MSRARTRSRAAKGVPSSTGRDGAMDFALRLEDGEGEGTAAGHVYRVIELVGTSELSIDDAVRSAVARAHRTLRNLRWFEVVRSSGHIEAGEVRHFQVTLKVGFTMEQAK